MDNANKLKIILMNLSMVKNMVRSMTGSRLQHNTIQEVLGNIELELDKIKDEVSNK